MNKNMNSPSKLTEFAPLSPEESQPVVASIFSKIFGFAKSSTPSVTAATSPNNDEQSSSGDSESWKQPGSTEKSPSEDTSSLMSFSVDTTEGRSLPNVLKRISNIVALKSNNLQSYKDSQLRSYWMPDSVSKQCYECGERFTTFRRRHHCRVCGQIFCSKCCCDEIPGKIMGCTGDLRVCTYCCKVVLSYLQSSDMRSDLSADLRALQEDLEEKYGTNSPPTSNKCTNETTENETLVRRKLSVGYMEEKYATGRSSHNYLTSHERALALQNSTSLRMIYEELFRSNQAIILQTHRIRLNRYYNCFIGNELVNWMIAQNRAATRIQATAIGQALFEAGFIEPVLMDNAFSDSAALFKPAKLSRVQSKDFLVDNQTSCDAQEPAWVKNIPQHDSTTDSESESRHPPQVQGRMPSSSSSFYLDLNLEASTVTLKRPTSEDIISTTADCNDEIVEQKEVNFQTRENKVPEDLLNDKLLVQDIKKQEGWHQVANLNNAFNESTVYNSLTSVYKQHEDSLLRQLLNKEGLSQNWSEVVLEIAHQIIDRVRPDLHHDADDMDVRQYVQIKKSPGGSKNDCEIISGVVCSKNVAHKGMNAMIANPKILLLRCGLMYQRVEGRLLSLEPVMLQENEYLGHTVARINALGPDIVLVHRSVSRLAQDRLRECGITLVLNVKLSILERLARCTGANIVDTIDAHISARYRLGTCFSFKAGVKTLMYFEGCANPHLGATILLRGGSQNELRKVKNVASMMIFAAYSCRLEKSFLMDEFARPPSPKDNSFLDESSRNASPSKTKESIGSQNQEDEDSILEKPKKSTDDTSGVISGEDQSFDNHLPMHKSTLVKSDSNDRKQSIENISDSENFNQVSALLMNATSSYDTLKLFKTKSKSSSDESKIGEKTSLTEVQSALLETSSQNDTSGIGTTSDHDSTLELFGKSSSGEAAASDETRTSKSKEIKPDPEKRVHGESVSDKSDPLHQYMNEDEDEVFDQVSPNGQCLSVADLPLLNKFKKALEGTILSVSPYLKFSIPYLETEPGRNCVLRSFFPKELYYSAYFSDKMEGAKLTSLMVESASSEKPMKKIKFEPEHPFIKAKLTAGADSREVQTMLAHFRACGGRLHPVNGVSVQKKQSSAPTQNESMDQQIVWPDCLDPASHQRLSVLFCSFLHNNNTNNAPAFCVNPWVVNMDLYGRNDIALGRFLERYCLTTEYKCPAQSCRAQISQHVRRFVHDGGCVHISLCEMSADPFTNPGQESSKQIFMWSKCTKCKSVSPVVPISDDTWSLSFAKYLELRFHGNVYTRRGAENCQHSLHHDHQQYFSKRNMLTIMRYSKISQWEISLPPPLIDVIYDSRIHASVIEEIKSLALKGDEVFCNVKDKISGLQLDEAMLANMKIQLGKDQLYFKNKIEELQLKLTSPTLENKRSQGKNSEKQVQSLMYRVEDGIVIVKRLISDAVLNWNAKIAEATASAKRQQYERQTNKRTTVERSSLTATNSVSGSSVTGAVESNDGYITEDTASESQLEDLSPMSADYNAVDAIAAIQANLMSFDPVESSDGELPDPPTVITNPEEIVVIQGQHHCVQFHFNCIGSPKTHERSFSDTMPPTAEDAPDKKKKKKTILSQLLPSTSTTTTIPNPLGPLEHHLLPLGSVVPIVVYESEPSSIIAYALDSHDYKHALQEQLRGTKGPELNPSPLYRRKLPENKENVSEINQSGESKRPSVLSFLRGNSPNPNALGSPMETDKVVPSIETTGAPPAPNPETDEEKKAAKQQQHNYIEVQFADSTTNFYCRIYFAAQFAALRNNVLTYGEEGYTRSLSRSVLWAARGGKSGSSFCKTKDDRFVLKEMTRMDMQIFLDFAPNYFAYMEKCQQTKQPTLLGKIVGIYRVSFKNNTTNAALRTSVLVMENLFYNRSITDKFDLKGSVRNRLVNPEDVDHEGELVLLDENLLNMSCDSPLYIRPHAKAVLNKAIEEDTKFLADNCVMDYSLLVGLEPTSDELVLGIIDYLRTFTWDKKIETMVKKSGILGGQGKLPTIVSPGEYRARFIAAMHKYFLPVPDRWTGLNRGVTST
ncbi:hypothetical protein TSAR_004798 [Trichomalopsis sarcophagae]|uniref:1-phosphatidylinositol-3-phosphate 5-kinase n=1 Tax=Trichomalopsis sarcophagae TaxID=543379 RepID=A0A232FAE2_9HYME|nr:hypothetical protein TSAR_004798 [Trichomalopsis sarcophagae]